MNNKRCVLSVLLIVVALGAGHVILAQEEAAPEKQPVKPEKVEPVVKAKKKVEKAPAEKEAKISAPAVTRVQPESVKIVHSAIGAKVVVSSTHTGMVGEASAEALVDGDLATRWSSAYSAPQEVTIDLGKVMSINTIVLHWESAFASKYRILLSQDGQDWTNAHFFFRMGEKKDVRTDDVNMKGVLARAIRLDLDARTNDEWGFSLYEIEIQASEKQEVKNE